MVVDITASYIERRQGIRLENYWHDLDMSRTVSAVCFMLASLAFNLWIMIDRPTLVELE